MDGQTTVEEEKALADYFRTHDVPAEWEDYRAMFSYFDRGMEGELLPETAHHISLSTQMGRRWWGIAAAAVIAVAVVGTVVLHQPSTTTQTVVAKSTPDKTQDFASLQKTEQSPPEPSAPLVETKDFASLAPARPASRTTRHLKAENKRLAEENERLQRELADLKRRSFIIDLEANGYKTVLNEDGNIVLIDMEQEIENELNNQPTTNIPAL